MFSFCNEIKKCCTGIRPLFLTQVLSFYTKASLRYKSLRISQDAPGIQVDFVQKFDINPIFLFLLFQAEKQKQWAVLLSSFCLPNIMCFCNNFWNVNLRFPYRRKNRSVVSDFLTAGKTALLHPSRIRDLLILVFRSRK